MTDDATADPMTDATVSPATEPTTDATADPAIEPTTGSLAALLAHDGRRGVFRPAGETTPATIERIATAAGWQTAVADTAGVADKRAVIATIRRALGFDAEVGLNLDALNDVLRDVEAEPGTLLLWSGAADFADADTQQYRHVLDVLRSRAHAAADGQPGGFLTLLV